MPALSKSRPTLHACEVLYSRPAPIARERRRRDAKRLVTNRKCRILPVRTDCKQGRNAVGNTPCNDERADASLAISTFPERPVDSGLIQIAHSIKQSEGAAFSLIELLDFFPEMREPAKLDVQALRGGGDVNSLGDVWHGKKPDWNRMHAEVRQ